MSTTVTLQSSSPGETTWTPTRSSGASPLKCRIRRPRRQRTMVRVSLDLEPVGRSDAPVGAVAVPAEDNVCESPVGKIAGRLAPGRLLDLWVRRNRVRRPVPANGRRLASDRIPVWPAGAALRREARI